MKILDISGWIAHGIVTIVFLLSFLVWHDMPATIFYGLGMVCIWLSNIYMLLMKKRAG